MKYLKLLLCLIVFPSMLFAQSNYAPGYVVGLNGDTLSGFINYREWVMNPKEIAFKHSQGDAKATRFDRSRMKSFGLTGFAYYERHVVSISQDSVDINYIKTQHKENAVTDTVFLKILTRGKHLTLYRYTDTIKPRFYLSKTGGAIEPEELAYHLVGDSDQQGTVKFVRRFRNQLIYAAQAVHAPAAVEEMTGRAEYNEGDLVKIVTKINGGADSRFVSSGESGSRWFAGLGCGYYSLTYDGHTPLSDASPKSGVTPIIDAGIDLFPFTAVQKFYLRLEAGVSYYQFNYNQPDKYTDVSGANLTLNVKQFNAMFTPQAIYNIYNGQNLKVFIDVGLGLNYSTYNQYQQVITYEYIEPYVKKGYPSFDRFWVTWPVKAGIAVNKQLEVYIIYTPSRIISDQFNDGSQGTISQYGAGFNYYFGKR